MCEFLKVSGDANQQALKYRYNELEQGFSTSGSREIFSGSRKVGRNAEFQWLYIYY